MVKYLSKYFFGKYEDEAIFSASECGLPLRTSTNTEPVVAMVYDANIMLNSLRKICNYIRDAFGKRDI